MVKKVHAYFGGKVKYVSQNIVGFHIPHVDWTAKIKEGNYKMQAHIL